MSENGEYPTPSQAEGESDEPVEERHPDVTRTTPSQAEGDDIDEGGA
ncbi:hypothetical protein ABT354_09040 [Streptomyces sp. NPDC000594]